jgi:fructan beta-fructosidase
MFPVEHMVQFYRSKNLKEWTHLSDFGPAGDTAAVWECPDLTQVPVSNMPGKKKWLLQMSQNASMQYFVGEFDGVHFSNENSTEKINRPDYGPDYYAAIAYNQLPATIKPTSIGWVNNWNYANDIPTAPWKSAMSLPRNLSVKKINGEWLLLQQPTAALKLLRQKPFELAYEEVTTIKALPVNSNQFEIELELAPGNGAIGGVRIAAGDNHYIEIGYDAAKNLLYIDRSTTENSFNSNYKNLARFEKMIALINKKIKLQIYYDHSIVEVFVNDGAAVFTSQVFTAANHTGILLFNQGAATSRFTNLRVWQMKAVW